MLPAVNKVPDPLADLERRQDEALQQLDELEAQIERALREFTAVQQTTAELVGRTQKAAA